MGLSDLVEIARACGHPKRTPIGVVFRCPCHEDKQPSCAAWYGDTAIRVKCFAGCDNKDIVDALRAMGFTLSQREAEQRAKRDLSITPKARRHHRPIDPDLQKRIDLARKLWANGLPIRGTLAERYLEARGLSVSKMHDLDWSLRFHPLCPRGKFERWPTLLAAFRDVSCNVVTAVQRIFLDKNGNKFDRMMLGAPAEAAVMLTSMRDTFKGYLVCPRIYVCEGVETGIGALMLGYRPVWALGTTSLITSFKPLFSVRELVVLTDHDKVHRLKNGDCTRPGIAAAQTVVKVWRDAGWSGRMLMPDHEGDDYADVAARWRASHGNSNISRDQSRETGDCR